MSTLLAIGDFDQAVAYMLTDVRRELQLARSDDANLQAIGVTPGGGNFLAALGLLCYTEFGGRLITGTTRAAHNFNTFFDRLGPECASFRKDHDVYDIFRCGLAHEYYVKKSCTIAMFSNPGAPAIGYDHQSSRYWFIVDSYSRALEDAFKRLRSELYGARDNGV